MKKLSMAALAACLIICACATTPAAPVTGAPAGGDMGQPGEPGQQSPNQVNPNLVR